MISNERNGSNNSRGHCIKAVRTLASCNTELCQDLLEILIVEAWNTGSDNKERLAVVPSLEKLLNGNASILSNNHLTSFTIVKVQILTLIIPSNYPRTLVLNPSH